MMMMDIFSSFDPYINISFQYLPFIFWFLIIFIFIIIRRMYWVSYNSLNWVLSYPLDIINIQSSRTFSTHIKGFRTILVSIFLIFILINFLGLLPYRFRYSSHIVFRLIFGLPIWLCLIISSLVNSPKKLIKINIKNI